MQRGFGAKLTDAYGSFGRIAPFMGRPTVNGGTLGTHSRDRDWIRKVAAATFTVAALWAAPASAYTVDPGWIASDYATGFPTPSAGNEAGPLGLAFDGAGNLLVTDIASGTLYRVPPGGGHARDSL